MKNRYEKIFKALEVKPAMGEPCNNCGWCCLTETCPTGLHFAHPDDTVCRMLEEIDGKFYCLLATTKQGREILDIGGGCDAISALEKLRALL